MSTIVRFPVTSAVKGPQRIQAAYTIREISRQFGLSETIIRRWVKAGVITPLEPSARRDGGLRFGFHALETFRRASELRNQGMSLRRVEAELHGQLNLFPETEGQLIPLPVRVSPFEEALILHEHGDPRAINMYEQAIKEGESVPDAYCNLGILRYEAQDIPRAFDNFTRALGHDPRHFESHFNLAHLYFAEGDVRLARLHYDIAAIIEPGNASVHFNLGLVNAVEGNAQAAIAALGKAKEFATETELAQINDILAGMKNADNGAAIWPLSALRSTDNS